MKIKIDSKLKGIQWPIKVLNDITGKMEKSKLNEISTDSRNGKFAKECIE